MPRSSIVGARAHIEPKPEDNTTVAVISRAVAETSRLTVRLPTGEEIELPEALIRILKISADELSAGRAVTILASEDTLTPAEVGELLGLSRPFVVRLLDQGLITSENLPNSKHRVVRLADVLAFQARRNRLREGSRRMSEVIESEDLPY